MNKKTGIWLVIAACLVILGTGLFTVALGISGWDFSKLDSAQYATNTHRVTEAFTHIQIHADTADILVLPSEDGNCRVVCHERENARHTVTVEQGTLKIRVVDERKWYEYIGFNFGQQKLTLYLPQQAYEALSIQADTSDVDIRQGFTLDNLTISVSTGHIHLDDLSASQISLQVSTGHVTANKIRCNSFTSKGSTGNLQLRNMVATGVVTVNRSTGDVQMENIQCGSFRSKASTGDLELRDLIAGGTISIERSTGHVKLEACDGVELSITTNTGDVEGSLLTPKIFFTETDTGDVHVPQSTTGGKCVIRTNTGDISIRIHT